MRWSSVAVAAAGVLLLTAACGGKDGAQSQEKAAKTAARVTITPGDGSAGVKPDKGIIINAADGTLESVSASYKGKPIPGEYSGDKLTWKTTWPLAPDTAYQVTAIARARDGKQTTVTSSFRTLKPEAKLLITDVTPQPGEKVGVGMPIIVRFNRTVGDKKAVERGLLVKSTKPATGAWFWTTLNGVQAAIFRPKNGSYWQPNQSVTFTAHLAGVKSEKGVYGGKSVKRSFRIGDAHMVSVNSKTHRATVTENGKKVRSWGVSLGSGGGVEADGVDHLLTTSGVHLTMAHSRLERMRPPGKKKGDDGWYDEMVPWATRISDTGEYIHQNMGNPAYLGNSNQSHGCVRSPGEDAKWFMNWSYRGDVVTITGTERKLDWNNGWGYYQMPWSRWVKGSALKQMITT